MVDSKLPAPFTLPALTLPADAARLAPFQEDPLMNRIVFFFALVILALAWMGGVRVWEMSTWQAYERERAGR